MDRILIRDLRVNTLIGTYPAERERRQQLVLNLEIGLDLSGAAASDELGDTVNYAEIEERVTRLAAAAQFRLIERLAGAVGALVLEYEPVRYVKVLVEKPGAARHARAIAVEIECVKPC